MLDALKIALWETALAPEEPWQTAYAFVGEQARLYLINLPAGEEIGTSDFVKLLYEGSDRYTQQRVFKALKALAAHQLADCWTRAMRNGKRDGVYKMWHRPQAKKCPHCGGLL